MLIGNKYSDNKIYRGIRFYDKLPMISEDMHEYSDTVFMKNAYIMNNIIGYGALNSPRLSISSNGMRLSEPAVVLIDGDISLIQSDDNTDLIRMSDIVDAGYTSGVVGIVGWYQHITSQSTMRNYGGVNNSILDNDLLDEKFGVQVSSRYQFRWFPVLLEKSSIDSNTITFVIANRDDKGDILSGTSVVTTKGKYGDVFLADIPTPMSSYAKSDLYIIPLIDYTFDSSESVLTGANSRLPVKPKGTSGFINSETEPVGEYIEGTTWYNPITREFKTYVSGTGFVSSASTMGFLQYHSMKYIDTDITEEQDIIVPIGIDELQEGDILQVSYDGLFLIENAHYKVDYTNHTITLQGFTAEVGDKIGFTVTKIVEANDITNITSTFTKHMASTGSSTIEAHVKLTDSIDSKLDQSNGVAATPKSVYESTLLKDTANNVNYKFGVADGLLYLEEV